MKLCISTAGVGSRLNDLTRYLNKSLIRVGKQPALGYLLDWAPPEVPVVIILGYKGELVRDYLELSFPERKFEFVTVEAYEGPGTSMGKSLLAAQRQLNCPFVLATCDTIINGSWRAPDENWIGVSEGGDGTLYSTVIADEHDYITHVNPKGEAHFDAAYIGLIGVHDHDAFWRALRASNSDDPEFNDCAAVRGMLRDGARFKRVDFPFWLDVGNIQALNHAREVLPDRFDNLEKLDEAIYFRPGCVVKFFANPDIVKARVQRAKSLKGLVPEVEGVRENFYRYRFARGRVMSEVVTERLLLDFLYWCETRLWIPVNANIRALCHDFYFRKTKSRLEQLQQRTGLPLPQEQLDGINWSRLCNGIAACFHGDLHGDNIIVKPDGGFVLLDWRQDFAGAEYGDVYYDLAKLNHGFLVQHEMVCRGLYTKEGEILAPVHLSLCREAFLRYLRQHGYDLYKVEVLTALIFLNIAALHHYPYDHFLYNFGCKFLERSLRNEL